MKSLNRASRLLLISPQHYSNVCSKTPIPLAPSFSSPRQAPFGIEGRLITNMSYFEREWKKEPQGSCCL